LAQLGLVMVLLEIQELRAWVAVPDLPALPPQP